jgi:hypothetical protein
MRLRPIITEADLSLVLDVIRCNQSLERALYVALKIERATDYPISTIANLKPAFNYADRFTLGDRSLRPQDLANIFPDAAFPIESRDELITQLIMAFERERMAPIKSLAEQQGSSEVFFDAVQDGKKD